MCLSYGVKGEEQGKYWNLEKKITLEERLWVSLYPQTSGPTDTLEEDQTRLDLRAEGAGIRISLPLTIHVSNNQNQLEKRK